MSNKETKLKSDSGKSCVRHYSLEPNNTKSITIALKTENRRSIYRRFKLNIINVFS